MKNIRSCKIVLKINDNDNANVVDLPKDLTICQPSMLFIWRNFIKMFLCIQIITRDLSFFLDKKTNMAQISEMFLEHLDQTSQNIPRKVIKIGPTFEKV